jgi:hypothetical protein
LDNCDNWRGVRGLDVAGDWSVCVYEAESQMGFGGQHVKIRCGKDDEVPEAKAKRQQEQGRIYSKTQCEFIAHYHSRMMKTQLIRDW